MRKTRQQPDRADPIEKVEKYLVRVKFIVFEVAMLVCFLVLLYEIVRRELSR